MERFWNKVKKTETCWNWIAAKTKKGYGRFKLNGKLESPHRVSYALFNNILISEIEGVICHRCDNPSCVNPAHLFMGTSSENMLDCSRKGRLVVPEGVRYKKGHTPSNAKHSKKLLAIISAKHDSGEGSLKDLSELYKVSYRSLIDYRRRK